MTTCLQCDNLDLQAFPKHAGAGFGRCKKDPALGVFVNLRSCRRACPIFKAASEKIVLARVTWSKKL